MYIDEYSNIQDEIFFIYLFVYCSELPRPVGPIQERPEVKSIIIGTITFCMICWRYHSHFVSIDGIVPVTKLSVFVLSNSRMKVSR